VGEEISNGEFSTADFGRFKSALKQETEILRAWFQESAFAHGHGTLGYELEAWCMDNDFQPAPRNEEFLAAFNNPMVVEELARFIVEYNAPPETIGIDTLNRVAGHLRTLWDDAARVAQGLDMRLAMIGILPTASQSELTMENMSNRERYRALNKEVLRMRHNNPLRMDIEGNEHLRCDQRNVMLESAATSLQIHLQVDQFDAAHYYNAVQVLSGPMVAAASNSPFLFGYDLWAETRIPLFEQAVNTVDSNSLKYAAPARVVFGDAYLHSSLLELFDSNLENFPVLLPADIETKTEELGHLRLHNGTIWRWNRPLVGFDVNGKPHLRIEHRTIPSGPSIEDIVANIALFVGLLQGIVRGIENFEQRLPFEEVRDNFYRAACDGLEAKLAWVDGGYGTARSLLLDNLLPMARQGLQHLGLGSEEVGHYMDIVERRVKLRRTGSDWQRGFVGRYGRDMSALTKAYWERQQTGAPVCDWEL